MNVCFVSLHAYPVLVPEAPGFFGGTETRAVTLAQGFAQYSPHTVQFLCRNPQLRHPIELQGITFLPWRDFRTECRAHVAEHIAIDQLPRKFVLKKWSPHLLWELPYLVVSNPFYRWDRNPFRVDRTFDALNTDLYATFGVHSASAKVIHNAHRLQKKTVLFLGSDADVDPRYRPEARYRTPYGERAWVCYEVLRQADVIVSQNEFQQQKLEEHFERSSLLLRNPIDPQEWTSSEQQTGQTTISIPFQDYVLWIGRADHFHKRADLALEVARTLPDQKFVLVLNPRDPQVEQEIRQNVPANVCLISQVPFTEMPRLFQQAKLYLNTSAAAYEGFPNAFLQAVCSGVPIASLEVGPEYLQRSRAGLCAAGDKKRLSEIVQKLLQSNDSTEVDLHYAQQDLQHYHSLQATTQILAKMMEQLHHEKQKG